MTAIILRSFAPRFEIRDGDSEAAWNARADGENSLWRIWIYGGIARPAAVAAQELYEWRFWWVMGFLLSLPLIAALTAVSYLTSWGWMAATPILIELGLLAVDKLYPIQRFKELRSHEIETQAAVLLYGADEEVYRIHESTGMQSYAWLKHLSFPQIIDGMLKNREFALRWVKRNREFLEKVKAAT